jgi:hypothetical protein
MLDVGIGRNTITGKVVRLPWHNNIGAFIVGRPGSGKSHVIASLLIQYAIRGAEIVIGEYNADPDNKESLIYRTRSIHHLFKAPYATTGKEIESLIQWLHSELKQRQRGKEKTPLVVVLDEFLAFSRNVLPPQTVNIKREGDSKSEEGETRTIQRSSTYWDMIVAIQSDLRKNNIRLILAVQDPAAQAGTSLRQIRDMFNYKLIMRLGAGAAKLCGITDTASQKIVETLPTGYVFMRDIEDRIVGVPYPINPAWLVEIPDKPREMLPKQTIVYDWSSEDKDLYFEALFRYAPVFDMLKIGDSDPIPAMINTKDDLIRLLILMGKGNDFIVKTIKGNDTGIRESIAHYRGKYDKQE